MLPPFNLRFADECNYLLGYSVPGLRGNLYKNYVTGFLVYINNELALVKAIKKLASDSCLPAYLGQNARKFVEEEFDREIVLKGFLDFYQTELNTYIS